MAEDSSYKGFTWVQFPQFTFKNQAWYQMLVILQRRNKSIGSCGFLAIQSTLIAEFQVSEGLGLKRKVDRSWATTYFVL